MGSSLTQVSVGILMLGLAHAGGLSALTPQQYCEALEARSPGSFEILNMEDSTGTVSTIKSKRSFLLDRFESKKVDVEACGLKYSVQIPTGCHFDNNHFDDTYGFACFGSIQMSLLEKPAEIPFCPTNGQGIICDSPSACFGLQAGQPIQAYQVSTNSQNQVFKETLFGSMGRACANRRGINFKNGNSCSVSNFELSAGNSGDGATGLFLNWTETTVDSGTRVKVKYCAAGSFHLATLATGPLSSAYDSVVSCIRGSGQGIAGDFTSIKPLQGDILSDLKLWLIDRNGCK